MYRRRRQTRDKMTFGFDSFLDVVANVIGIVLRLILVAWVGARSYTAGMQWLEEKEAPGPAAVAFLPPPRAEDDPLSGELTKIHADIAQAKERLLEQMRRLDLAKTEQTKFEQHYTALAAQVKDQEREGQIVDTLLQQKGGQVQNVTLALGQIQEKSRKLLEELRTVEKQPAPAGKVLRFRTPVSRPVRDDEIFFECKGGKVTFIDLPAFLHEVRDSLDSKADLLRSQWKVDAVTTPVGAFRLRYVVERRRDFVDVLASGAAPPKNSNFSYGLSEWTVEPITENRGETLQAALAPGSYFRNVIDGLDHQAVVTLWVYPDSFEMFRQLRDHLYARDIEVAGRPLPPGAPIAASRNGTASRGQ